MNIKATILTATDKALSVTPSVRALARLMGVEVKKLAEAVYDEEADASYLADLAGEMVKEATRVEKAEEAKNK